MAIVENFWLRNSRKRLAGSVIYKAMGQTRQRALATSVNNPRTEAQQSQRVKWANLVNLYRANRDWMKYAFETKQEKQSEYNKFMSLNVSSSRIYLPKQVANAGGCVVDGYIITQGSLPSIEHTVVGDNIQTNIFLSSDDIISTTATVGEVSRDLLQMNPALREGDQLSFIMMAQQTNSDTGFPYVVVRKFEVIIDTTSLRLWANFMPFDYIGTGDTGEAFNITIQTRNVAGGFAMILSRTIGGKTFVSTQRVVVVGNASMIGNYSSDAALQAAIQSYGESSDAFLSTTTASEDQQAAVSMSIVAVEIDNTPVTIGGSVYPVGFTSSSTIKLTFNQDLPDAPDGADVYVFKNTTRHDISITNVALSGTNVVVLTLPASAEDYAAWALEDIYVQINGTEYRAPFFVPNAATISGLE